MVYLVGRGYAPRALDRRVYCSGTGDIVNVGTLRQKIKIWFPEVVLFFSLSFEYTRGIYSLHIASLDIYVVEHYW